MVLAVRAVMKETPNSVMELIYQVLTERQQLHSDEMDYLLISENCSLD